MFPLSFLKFEMNMNVSFVISQVGEQKGDEARFHSQGNPSRAV